MDTSVDSAYLRSEAGQEPLRVPLALPLLRLAALGRVLLQDGGCHRGLVGELGRHRAEEVPLVLLHF